jgi:ferric-dicitrate binding protein FerR (iron transport regulator)
MSPYLHTLEDFMTHEDFIKWVKSPSDESNAYWNAWFSKNPDKRKVASQAREMILLLDFKQTPAPEGKFLEVWERISQASEEKTPVLTIVSGKSASKSPSRWPRHWYFKIAASIVFCLTAAGLFTVYKRFSTVTIATAYGESRTLFLPDGTKVTLNSNSRLSYRREDFSEHQREVWLDGQAFFAVTHKTNDENFRVHTAELQVEVLGTRFDVNSRRGRSKVVLEEGQVKLDIQYPSREQQTVMMKPGDLVEVSEGSHNITHQVVDPKDYLQWRNNRIEFVGSELGEIAHWLEDNYGYTVVFSDTSLVNHKFTGSCSTDDMQELMQKLSRVFNLDIQQEGTQITIKKQ